jgi:ribosomal subunit interface protein
METLYMKTEVAILHHMYPSSFREVVASKMDHLVRFFDGTQCLRAVLDKQHDEHRVEMIASVRQGTVLVVEGRAGNIGAALDDAIDRMGRSLRRHKDKLVCGRRRAKST